MLLWLSTTPPRYHLKELSFDLCDIDAASRLIADTSLTTLDVRMRIDDDDKLFGTAYLNSSPTPTLAHSHHRRCQLEVCPSAATTLASQAR